MAPIVVTVTKESKNNKLGIGLIETTHGITITSIQNDGLFADKKNSELKRGMIILSVNDKKCKDMRCSQVLNLLKTADGQVTLVVDDEESVRRGTHTTTTSIPQFLQPVKCLALVFIGAFSFICFCPCDEDMCNE